MHTPANPRSRSLRNLALTTGLIATVAVLVLTAEGQSITAQRSGLMLDPQLRFGVTNQLGTSLAMGGHVELGVNFDQAPIFIATIDETIDNGGAVSTRLRRWNDNRITLRSDAPADGVHWMAIDPGVHTISGKQVMAGRLPAAVNGSAVFFPQIFSVAPVVLLYVDESVDDNGALYVRSVGTVTTGGFQLWLDLPADGVHWIAMEPGDYTHGRYRWTAGTFPGLTNLGTYTFPQAFDSLPRVLLSINDTNNSGAFWVRLHELTNQSFRIRSNSSSEFLHYVAFEVAN